MSELRLGDRASALRTTHLRPHIHTTIDNRNIKRSSGFHSCEDSTLDPSPTQSEGSIYSSSDFCRNSLFHRSLPAHGWNGESSKSILILIIIITFFIIFFVIFAILGIIMESAGR